MKTAFKSVFVDTALFIYLRFLNFCHTNQVNLVTSILTYSEFCVKPYREHRLDLIQKYQEMIHASAIKEHCEIFACNDKRLKIVTEIQVMTLDEFRTPDNPEQAEAEQAA